MSASFFGAFAASALCAGPGRGGAGRGRGFEVRKNLLLHAVLLLFLSAGAMVGTCRGSRRCRPPRRCAPRPPFWAVVDAGRVAFRKPALLPRASQAREAHLTGSQTPAACDLHSTQQQACSVLGPRVAAALCEAAEERSLGREDGVRSGTLALQRLAGDERQPLQNVQQVSPAEAAAR
eukprot:4037829-Prymnesium_polylepis.1